MGYRCSWLAVDKKCNDLSDQLWLLRLELTGETSENLEFGFNVIETPEWNILLADGIEPLEELDEERAKNQSDDCDGECLFFFCADSGMCTQLISFKHGEEIWRVAYDAVNGDGDVIVSGDAPELVGEKLGESKREQAANDGADYLYETTAKIGQAITEFRHDELLDKSKAPYPVQHTRRKSK